MLEFIDVSYSIPNGQSIYENLNLKIIENEYYGILGKNGAGKSTLIEMIMGMRKLTKGTIKAFNENVSASNRKHKQEIFVVTHDMSLPVNIQVKNIFEFYKFFYPDYDINIQNKLLNEFDIELNQKFGSLSTGQKVKALLICAFASKAKLYLFDEVTAVLDPKSRHFFFKFLAEFRQKHNCSIILATNILEDLENSMDKVIFIDGDHSVKIKNANDLGSLFEDKVSA